MASSPGPGALAAAWPLALALALGAACAGRALDGPMVAPGQGPGSGSAAGAVLEGAADAALLDDLERRTFDFFWKTADPRTGLVPDRYPTPSFSSIAAVGFGLTAYPIGAERGYVTRAAA